MSPATQTLMSAHDGSHMEQIMNAELTLCQEPENAGFKVLSPVGSILVLRSVYVLHHPALTSRNSTSTKDTEAVSA